MQFKFLNDLSKEFKKYSGFLNSENIRNLSSKAVDLLNSSEICLPIDNSDSPIFCAFKAIINGKKYSKSITELILAICNCISVDTFQGAFLRVVLNEIEKISISIDFEAKLKIIQFSPVLCNEHFLDFEILCSIISILITFCGLKDTIITNNSIAAMIQIIDQFFVISNQKVSLDFESLNSIDSFYISHSTTQRISLSNPYNKVIYVLLFDLLLIIKKSPTIWIRVTNPSSITSYIIFDHLCLKKFKDISVCNDFLSILDQSFVHEPIQSKPQSYLLSLFNYYMEILPTTCITVFASFLFSLKNEAETTALVFFRQLFLLNNSIIIRYYSYCDPEGKQICDLFECISTLLYQEIGRTKPTSLSFGEQKNETMLTVSSSVEISSYFIQSCMKHNSERISELISKTWQHVISILSFSLKMIDKDSLHIPLQGIHSLMILSTELGLYDLREASLMTFLRVLMDLEKVFTNDTKQIALNTISALIEYHPLSFKGFWVQLLPVLTSYLWEPSSITFFSIISLDDQIQILSYLLFQMGITSNSTGDWSFAFFCILFLQFDFEAGASALYDAIFPQIIEIPLDLLLFFTTDGFDSKSESFVTRIIYRIMQSTNKKFKCRVLESLKSLITSKTSSIKSWSIIIDTLLINDEFSPEMIKHGFNTVQTICSDSVFIVSDNVISQIIVLLYSYIKQEYEINIALSSLELVWNIIPAIKCEKYWIELFDMLISIINNTRIEISQCSIKTIFSLIMSNAKSFSHSVNDYLLNVCFSSIIEAFKGFENSDYSSVYQIVLLEIVHCIKNMWNEFIYYESNICAIIEKSVEQNEDFMKACQKKEIVCNSFLLYEEVYEMQGLSLSTREHVFESLNRLAEYFVKLESPNSVIFGSYGRMIRMIFPSEHSYRNTNELNRWIKIMECLIFDMDCVGFLPPTAHKTFDSFDIKDPLTSSDQMIMFKLLIRCANHDGNPRLVEVAFEHIYLFIDQRMSISQFHYVFELCEPLFNKLSAQLVLDKLMKFTDLYKSEDVDLLFCKMVQVSKAPVIIRDQCSMKANELLPFVNCQSWETFISFNNDNSTHLIYFWNTLISPESSNFRQESLQFIPFIIQNLKSILSTTNSSYDVLMILSFLHSSSIYDVSSSTKSKKHLQEFMPCLSLLVKTASREALDIISNILQEISQIK